MIICYFYNFSLPFNIVQLRNRTAEHTFAQSTFLARHPAAQKWLNKYELVLYQLDIQQILVIDPLGRAQNVSVADYYNFRTQNDMVRTNDPGDGSAEDHFQYLSKDLVEVAGTMDHAKVAVDLVSAASKPTLNVFEKVLPFNLLYS